MGRCRRDKVYLTVAQRENFEQISGGGFITEYANRHNTLIVILYGKLLAFAPFERNIQKDSLKNVYLELYTENFRIIYSYTSSSSS
jgi:hypothetical protein